MSEIWNILKKYIERPRIHIIYFANLDDLIFLISQLENLGYENFKSHNKNNYIILHQKFYNNKYYSYLTNLINSENNENGEIIKVIFIPTNSFLNSF